jgi:hypothetical protein
MVKFMKVFVGCRNLFHFKFRFTKVRHCIRYCESFSISDIQMGISRVPDIPELPASLLPDLQLFVPFRDQIL